MIDHRVKYNFKYTYLLRYKRQTKNTHALGLAVARSAPSPTPYNTPTVVLFISASLRAHTRLQAPFVHGPLMLLCSRTGRSAQDLGHGSRPSFDACTYLLSLTGTLILELDISYWILHITAKN